MVMESACPSNTGFEFITFILLVAILGLQIYWMIRLKEEGDKAKVQIEAAKKTFGEKEEEVKKIADLARCKICNICEFKILTEQPFENLCKNPDLKCESCPK
jgi:hypothetical protein